MYGNDPHFHIAGYDLGIDSVHMEPDDAEGTMRIVGTVDGEHLPLASVPRRAADPTDKLPAVVTHLLGRWVSAVAFKNGRANSMVGGCKDDPIGAAADEVSDYGQWKREATLARETATAWDVYADALAALTAPGLTILSPFNPQHPAHRSGHFDRKPPGAARNINGHLVDDLVNTASANAAAYRRYADQVAAFVATEWAYLEHPDAFPVNEAEVLL